MTRNASSAFGAADMKILQWDKSLLFSKQFGSDSLIKLQRWWDQEEIDNEGLAVKGLLPRK